MKYIFLDIDGVLNSYEFLISDRSRCCHTLDESRVKLLAEIVHETGAAIVLSSSWRVGWLHTADRVRTDSYTAALKALFNRYDITVVGCTQLYNADSREEEIYNYVKNYLTKYDSWVAIDDENLHISEPRFVKTDLYKGKGLEEFHLPLIRKALNLTIEQEWNNY